MKKKTFATYYFIITYITTVLLTRPSQQIENIRIIIWLVPFGIWIINFLVNIIRKDKFTSIWFKRSKEVNVYFIVLGIVMVVTNLISVNVFYSIFSGLFSVALVGIIFNVIGPLLIEINSNLKHKKLITSYLLLILCFAILGDIMIPSWNWDSTMRFSGGVNPNMMALLSLFCFIWFLDLKIEKIYPTYSTVGIIMSISTLLWTFSRGRISSFLILIFYLLITNFFILMNPTLKYKFNKNSAIKNIILGIILILFAALGIYIVLHDQGIWNRLSTPLDGRINAWSVLNTGFKENIFFGSFGWWNSTDIIRQNVEVNMADSAHNLYLRLLSEIGIIGLVAVMFFPVILFLKSITKACFSKGVDKIKRKKLLLYSGAILAFFISQISEDQYMNGIGDFQTGLFVWILTLNYYYLIDNDLKIIKK